MFGKPPQNLPTAAPAGAARADSARIQGGGLVQVIVTNLTPLTFFTFLNDTYLPDTEVESLSISIVAPTASSGAATVRATLSHYVRDVTGARNLQHTELFPCTLEVVALDRRISITCMRPDSVDGLWISLGLKPDGTGEDVENAAEFRFLLAEGLLDGKLTYTDGTTLDLLPQ